MSGLNFFTEVLSPLDQFEIRDLFSLDIPVLGYYHFSITNIGFYLTIGLVFIIVIYLLSTNYDKLVSNKWSASQESLYDTILSIVTNQINSKKGQIYFPFIFTLFIFVLMNNLIGMVSRSLLILLLLISSILFFFLLLSLLKLILLPRPISCGSSSFACAVARAGNNKYVKNTNKKNLYYSSSYSDIHTKISKNVPRYSFNNKNTFYLNPHYITGFVDGEGCFSVSIFKDSRRITGWQVKPIFSISLHNKDINLLEAIQRTLNVGKIYKHGADSLQYRVSSLSSLQVIIEHFDKYPLITQKQADYFLFKEAVNLIINKEHLSLTGLLKCVGIKASLNWGLSEKFKEAFPNVIPINRPDVDSLQTNIKNLNWIRGFIEAEGSFQVITQNINNKINISLRISITRHIRDEVLLKKKLLLI